MQGKSIDKVDLAISSIQTHYMTRAAFEQRFDWMEQMKEIVKRIDLWIGK